MGRVKRNCGFNLVKNAQILIILRIRKLLDYGFVSLLFILTPNG